MAIPHEVLRAARHVVLTNLIGQGLGQSQSEARDLIDAARPAERCDIQFQFRIERRGLRLPLLQLFKLEAQINALEVLKNVKHAAKRDYAAERSRLVEILQLHRLHAPHQPRIIDSLHGAELRRRVRRRP